MNNFINDKNGMNIVKLVFTILLLITCFIKPIFAQAVANEEKGIVERYALYVASNRGGENREQLRYAGSDAVRLSTTMNEIGGIKRENSFVLIDPNKKEIDGTMNAISKALASEKGRAKRTEFIFYYSGHSDENSLLLGKEAYDYGQLKTAITEVPSDVHVVMLDSCFSGNFMRAKGGQRQKSFLMDDSSVVQGHAYLSSSSESETSQESDSLRASYFTHAMVTGLRGAADASGDNKVSLNELYYYAFNETLSKTESSQIGPQHPSYNITMVGSGDLVLTDITEAESVLVFPVETAGKYFIRTLDGVLVSELTKIKGNRIALALSEGYYSVTFVSPGRANQATIKVENGKEYVLNEDEFTEVARASGRARGDSPNITFAPVINVNPIISGSTSTADGASATADGAMASADGANASADGATSNSSADGTTASADGATASADGATSNSSADGTTASADGVTATTEVNSTAPVATTPAVAEPIANPVAPIIDDEWAQAIKAEALRRAAEIEAKAPATTAAVIPVTPSVPAVPVVPSSTQASNSNREPYFPGNEVNWTPFAFSIIRGFGFPSPYPDYVKASLGLISVRDKYVDGVQVSGLLGNITGGIKGCQVAGFTAIATGFIDGCQVAGFNAKAYGFEGLQCAGFMNTSIGNSQGLQAAGFLNIAKGNYEGFQAAGFMNTLNGSSKGFQAAGFLNIASVSLKGFQAAGFMNITDDLKGFQVAGFMNIGNLKKGAQIAGFMNIASGNCKGIQASGFLNIADKINGWQVGVINIADENDGVALGVLNFIKNGVMDFGVLFDTNGYAYLQYQGGTNKFFTTYMLGMKMSDEVDFLTSGFGIGKRIQLKNKWSIDVELLYKQVYDLSGAYELIEEVPIDGTDEEYEAYGDKWEEWSKRVTSYQIPEVRGTLNLSLTKNLKLFGTASLAVEVEGWNEEAFSEWDVIDSIPLGTKVNLHPTFSFGIKI